MSLLAALAALSLAAVAAAGVLRPFARKEGVEGLADPLEEERAGLRRSLRELERERAEGVLSDEDYRALRAETEIRAVAVLRALEARDRTGDLASSFRELREGGSGKARSHERVAPSAARRVAPVALVGGLVAALTVPLLAGAVRDRGAFESMTGEQASNPLTFFEERVRRHPGDLAARLDLAQRYLEVGDVRRAVDQYGAALRIDPRNPEARATLGFLLYQAGRPEEGLTQVDRALAEVPNYPEALYFKGVILLEGLDRPKEAAEALRAYLDAAPFGARRGHARLLLERAEQDT